MFVVKGQNVVITTNRVATALTSISLNFDMQQ